MEELSFEQYIEKNKELLKEEFKNLKKEDFIIVKARNPESPEQVLEQYVHKSQYQRYQQLSIEFEIPLEEMIFITLMYTLEGSEITPIDIKKEIRKFLDRQMIRIKNNANKMLLDSLKKITITQLKNKLNDKLSIPIRKLDYMEYSWRDEFKKVKSEYKDEEIYIKVKLASMLN